MVEKCRQSAVSSLTFNHDVTITLSYLLLIFYTNLLFQSCLVYLSLIRSFFTFTFAHTLSPSRTYVFFTMFFDHHFFFKTENELDICFLSFSFIVIFRILFYVFSESFIYIINYEQNKLTKPKKNILFFR